MKQTLFFLLAIFLFGCSDSIEIIPSGKLVNESRPIKEFSSIVLSDGISLFISQDNKHEVIVEADDNIINYVETYTKGETLYIRIKEGTDIDSYTRKKTVNVNISANIIEDLYASGGSTIKFNPICNFSNLDIEVSEGSSVEGGIHLNNLTYSISGGGSIRLHGECKTLNINSSGGSKSHLYDFISEIVQINISGGSIAELYANKELFVESASGGSKIYYKGDATIKGINSDNSSTVLKQ